MASNSVWDEKVIKAYLEGTSKVSPPARVSLESFKEASHGFFVEFPTQTSRVYTLQKKGKNPQKLTDFINSTYPLIHEKCIPLLVSFINFKKNNGSANEKSLYKNMDLIGFIDRLLRKRPVAFFGKYDHYLLRDGVEGDGEFEDIGTDREVPPSYLDEYLSYDEMKVSALLSVSSESFFINDGSRMNKGKPGKAGSFQSEGVMAGMVGARLKKVGYMEWQDCIVTKKQNTKRNGYGPMVERPHLQHVWARLWGEALPEWYDIKGDSEKFFEMPRKDYFNVEVYMKRIQMTAETLLAEAKSRATAKGLKAYIHVVGLGLGVWKASNKQDSLYVDAWGEALKSMDTSCIAHVDFSWIDADNCLGTKDGEVFPGTQVTIHFSKRSLHACVPQGFLLVVNYAWDGNALPGNEYWLGKLCSTGDGAAACSSEVAELHNAHINPNVCGANLHVAGKWGTMHIGEYAKKYLSNMSQTNKKDKPT